MVNSFEKLSFLKEANSYGQINVNNKIGNILYNLIKERNDIKNIVEIGTWNGLGSTLCILISIIDSGVEKNFTSIELYTDMYDIAVNNLKNLNLLSQVNLLNGSIIEYSDIFWFDHNYIKNIAKTKNDYDGISCEHYNLWYEKDLEFLKKSKNVVSNLPDEIDLLILDGGEYTSYPEWQKLKDRVKIVFLDDTNIFKCRKIREEILKSNEYEIIYDDLNERNGVSIFEKKTNYIENSLYEKIIEKLPITCVDAFILQNNKLLLLKRNNEPAKNEWWVPGGRVFKNEKLEDAMKRILNQEVNINIENITQIGITETLFENKHTINICYLINLDNQVMIELDEQHSEYNWFEINNLPDLNENLNNLIKIKILK